MTLLVTVMTVATAWAQNWMEVGTKEALNTAIADGAHIRLTADITLSAYLKIGQNTTQTVTIDLNSHTLKRSGLSSPDANGHVIEVFGKGTLTLQNGTLSGGYANNGGGICNYGTVTLDNVTITGCYGVNGGGIMNYSDATLTINGGSITHCRSIAGGGAIVNHGTAAISGCTMSDNTATTRGGAVWSDNTLTISNSTISGNVAAVGEHEGDGGAIHLEGGTATLTDVTITGNTSKDAGAVYVTSSATLTIGGVKGSLLSDNKSTEHGGGGIDNYGTVALSGKVTITGNSCKNNGAGLWSNGTLSMEGDIRVKGNEGDDVYLKKGKVIDVTGALTGGKESIAVHLEDFRGIFTSGYTASSTATIPFVANNINPVSVVDGECCQLLGYYKCSWDEEAKKVIRTICGVDPAQAIDNLCTAKYADGGGLECLQYWFVVDGTGATTHGLQCRPGEVHIILCDNSQLSIVGGLHTYDDDDSKLYIYCQSYDENTMGKLIVPSTDEEYDAGIGSRGYKERFYVEIHGGNISATSDEYGPGIGRGCVTSTADINTSTPDINNGTLVIYGGVVMAKGGDGGAGVGGGWCSNGINVTVHDGQLRAYGGDNATGIGSGSSHVYDTKYHHGGSLTVNGGYVFADGTGWGAGIGASQDSSGADVTINGGIVEAWAGSDAGEDSGCAIGSHRGDNFRGSLHIGSNMKVSAGQAPDATSTFSADQRNPACYFRPFARIEPCNHPNATVTINDGETHTANGCTYCLMNGKNQAHFFDNYSECSACHLIGLTDDKDNTEAINHWNDERKTVALTNRTFQKNGTWNALCLPFDLYSSNDTPLEGATIMTLDNASFANSTLTINFKEAARIEAGKPYIVKWDNDTEHPTIDNPIFEDVIINNASPDDNAVNTKVLTFQGQYAPLVVGENGDNTLLYIGDDNTLHYPENATTINAFRAWLKANSKYGDINGDGVVSVSDVTSLVNYILGDADEGTLVENADLSGDGIISVTDVTALVNLILHGSSIVNVVVNGAEGLNSLNSLTPSPSPRGEGSEMLVY